MGGGGERVGRGNPQEVVGSSPTWGSGILGVGKKLVKKINNIINIKLQLTLILSLN